VSFYPAFACIVRGESHPGHTQS